MAGETVITIVGNITADPELRFTPNGAAVANFTVASTPSRFDKQTQSFKDGDTIFMRCSAWREMGENVAESIKRGDRVMAQGTLRSRSWEKNGEKHTAVELDVLEIGPSLRYATAQVTKKPSNNNYGGGQSNYNRGGQQQQQNDPWASSNAQGGDEPPF